MSIAKHDNVTELSTQNLGALVELQRNEFRAEGEVTYATRIDRLKRLKSLIVENKKSSRLRRSANSTVQDPTNSACFQSSRQRLRQSTIR